ncbi:MAG: methylenetetrahydrofolate reductase, partial [Butyrivibrio sp.]|nr:methylenetetrahydrofolate reductase [Butyrivibrio sp.]
MKIREILSDKRPTLSYEVFPPKKEADFKSVEEAAVEIAGLKPDFMSVTYGAGGGTSRFTADVASLIQKKCGVTSIAHLTCVSSTREM